MNKLLAIMSIINGIASTVYTVQNTMGAEPGPTKQAEVIRIITTSLEAAQVISGKDIVDQKAFSKALTKTIDGIVAMLKATRFWKKK
jgi:hypothetical protein